jgi:hypothetical protein
MKHILLGLVVATSGAFANAATLLKGDIPTGERVQRLSAYFSPKPGEQVTLRQDEVRDFHRRVAPDLLRGIITVRPPSGFCLRISRDEGEADDVVCKPTTLSFRFSDLDPNGRLTWQIKTGDGDFGTALSWPSPYRIGSVIPFTKDPAKDPPEHVYLSSCTAKRGPTGRSIRLGLLSGETWMIHLPDTDEYLTAAGEASNLDVDFMTAKRGVKEAALDKADGKKEGEAKAEDGKKDGEASKGAEKAKDAAADARDDRRIWAIPARNACVMPSDRFQPNGSVARGGRGECRYIFGGPPEDPRTGRIECHEVDGYRLVFLPVTCLGELEVKRDPGASAKAHHE